MKIKRLFLIPILCLTSCNSSHLSFSFFNDFSWTQWVSEDGSSTIYVEGLNTTHSAVGFFENEDDLYAVNLWVLRGVYSTIVIHKNDGPKIGYTKKNYIDGKIDTKSFVCTFKSSQHSVIYHSKKIATDEIDLSHFLINDFLTNTKINFRCGYRMNEFNYPRKWVATVEGQEIELRFGENRTFEFTSGELTSIGTYTCDYEKATLSFTSNDIFEENEIVLTYVE